MRDIDRGTSRRKKTNMNHIHGVYAVRTRHGRILGNVEASCPNEALCVVKAQHATAPIIFPIAGSPDWSEAFEGATVELRYALV